MLFTRELHNTRLVICLLWLVLSGCGGDSPTPGNDGKANENTPRDDPMKKPGPPEKVAFLAPREVAAQFTYVPFAWSNAPANVDYLTPEERGQASMFGGFTRYTSGDTVRIKEIYYIEPLSMKHRWQEELRNGQWVMHGPEVFYDEDGRYEIAFRIDGEFEGPRIYFSADGQETSRQLYKGGIPVE